MHKRQQRHQTENLSSTSLSLPPTLPLQQDSTTDKEAETGEEVDLWVKNAMRFGPPITISEEGKPTGSSKASAGSTSSSSAVSGSKQATARQVAAELIRQGDLSLSAPFFSESGILDNLSPSQVGSDSAGKDQRLPVFTEEQRGRLQKSRAERIEPLKTNGSSASVEHASASEHALSNVQKLRELQERQELRAEGKTTEREGGTKALIKEPPAKGPRSLRVGSLKDLPASFIAQKNVKTI